MLHEDASLKAAQFYRLVLRSALNRKHHNVYCSVESSSWLICVLWAIVISLVHSFYLFFAGSGYQQGKFVPLTKDS